MLVNRSQPIREHSISGLTTEHFLSKVEVAGSSPVSRSLGGAGRRGAQQFEMTAPASGRHGRHRQPRGTGAAISLWVRQHDADALGRLVPAARGGAHDPQVVRRPAFCNWQFGLRYALGTTSDTKWEPSSRRHGSTISSPRLRRPACVLVTLGQRMPPFTLCSSGSHLPGAVAYLEAVNGPAELKLDTGSVSSTELIAACYRTMKRGRSTTSSNTSQLAALIFPYLGQWRLMVGAETPDRAASELGELQFDSLCERGRMLRGDGGWNDPECSTPR
jgi:hypothetical protein